MLRESNLRDAAAFVISGDDENWNPLVGHAREWLERLPGDTRRRTWAIEDVASVNDEGDVGFERRLQRRRIGREEVVSAATSLDARTRRQIEAEVGVSEEEDANAFGHRRKIDVIVACRRSNARVD